MHLKVEEASLSITAAQVKGEERRAHPPLWTPAWPSPRGSRAFRVMAPAFCALPHAKPQVDGSSRQCEEARRRKWGADERSTLFDKIVKSSLYCEERISE